MKLILPDQIISAGLWKLIIPDIVFLMIYEIDYRNKFSADI